MNRQYAFSRTSDNECAVVTVNNDESDYTMTLPVTGGYAEYMGALSGQRVSVVNGNICVNVKANSGDIWLPVTNGAPSAKEPDEEPVLTAIADAAQTPSAPVCAASVSEEDSTVCETACAEASKTSEASDSDAFQKGKIAGLQEAILAIMEKKGNVTEQMRKDVLDNVHHDSLINWVKSFH